MQRVDQNSRRRMVHRADLRRRGADIGDVRPGHEFQIRGHAMGMGELAEGAVALRHPRRFGIVAGREDVLRPQRLAALQEGTGRGRIEFRRDLDDLDIGDGDAGLLHRAAGLGQEPVIAEQRIGPVRARGQEAEPDMVEPGLRRDPHRLGRCGLLHGQEGKRIAVAHRRHFSGEKGSGTASVEVMSPVSQSGPPFGGQMPSATVLPRISARWLALS